MDNTLNKKGRGTALIPFLVFVVIYLGAGIILQSQGVEMAFYQFPSVTAMFIAVLVAFAMTKGAINERFRIFAKGAANEDVLTMLIIYLLAGAFSSVAAAMGGRDATVNLGLSLVPVHFLTAGVFIISAFMGTATGTSMGTISAIVPIAVGLADKGGLSVPMMVGACVGGAMFGDNLSMISDTTIAATRSQGCEMRDKFRVNFYIALPAAIITIIILLIVGRPEVVPTMEALEYSIIKVVPYLLVLILALVGMNVFLVLTIGIFAAGIIGMATGSLDIFGFAQNIWSGFTGMNEVFFLTLFCGGMSQLVIHNGGISWLIYMLRKMMKGNKSAQVGIAALVSLADCATANNTVAIVLTGSMAKDISREYQVDPRRTASLLDVFSCVFQGIIPYGAQLLSAATLTTACGIAMNPTEIIPNLWYCWVLAAVGILSVFVPFADNVCRRDPWNWEYGVAESGVAAKKAAMEQETAESASNS
jgi:Na+/H+ antiporter NhaC